MPDPHETPSPRADAPRSTGDRARPRPWKVFAGRAIIAVLLALSMSTLWPMAKGLYDALTPRAVVPADQLPDWRESYAEALTESALTGKPVLIDFSASWCPPCRAMEAEVWPSPEVRKTIAQHVVPLRIDVDDPEAAPVIQRYPMRYIPTLLIVDATGEELARGGYMSADQVVRFIKAHAPATPSADDPAAPTT